MDAKRLLFVLAAAVAGAVTIPLDRPGIGWAITGVAVLAMLRNWLGLVAAVLLGIGAVRSAGWVFVLCAVTAMVLLAVTVVSGRTWRELGLALPRWVWGSWRGFRTAAATSDRHGAARLARGIGVGLILVIVFGLLLGSAEEKFADLLRPLLSWPRLVTFAAVALLFLGALHFRKVAAAPHAGLAAKPEGAETHQPQTHLPEAERVGEARADESVPGAEAWPIGAARAGEAVRQGEATRPEEVVRSTDAAEGSARPKAAAFPGTAMQPRAAVQPGVVAQPGAAVGVGVRKHAERREWGRFEWAIPVALVDLLFATFAVVQFTVLFGGHEHVLDPDGPTYAQYARGGFVELASVTVLTLAVVAAALSRVARADGRLARVLVGVLCGLTLVIVGSALRRMQLYVEAFGFTRTRLLATAVIIWLGLILLLLLAVWRRAILPRLTLAAGALVLLGLAALNPDRIVAQTVIGRWEDDGHLDAPYLASLSVDALPALEKLPDPKRSCISAVIVRRHLDRGDAWNEWNAARANARGILLREADCAYYLSVGYRMEGNWTDPSEVRQGG